MKVNVPIDLRLFTDTLKPLGTLVEGGYQLMKNVGHYDCLKEKLSVEMVYNGYKYF